MKSSQYQLENQSYAQKPQPKYQSSQISQAISPKSNGNQESPKFVKNQQHGKSNGIQISQEQEVFKTPVPKNQSKNSYEKEQIQPAQSSEVASQDEIQLLKQHLKSKYKNYTDQEIDEIIQKFIGEYLQNMQKGDPKEEANFNDDQDGFETESRASLASHLDWNNKNELEKYCKKQKRIEEEQGFRPSQYFGAISVDQLEDGIDDSRIDELFEDCFGLKQKPKIEKKQSEIRSPLPQQNNKKQQQCSQKQQQNKLQQQPPQQHHDTSKQLQKPQYSTQNLHSQPSQHQVQGNNNTVQNDQSCKIIVNFYNQFQILNNEQQQQLDQQHQKQTSQQPDPKKKDSKVKSNHSQTYRAQNEKQNTQSTAAGSKGQSTKNKQNCQVLDQDDSQKNKTKGFAQDSLKKYMQNGTNPSKKEDSISLNKSNEFNLGENFKSQDNRINYQPYILDSQVHSPNHFSSLQKTGFGVKSFSQSIGTGQLMSHYPSLGNLALSSQNQKQSKHQTNYSICESVSSSQQHPNGLLYHQLSASSNHQHTLSNTSSLSLEQKPKSMNKLSYLSQKNLQDPQLPSQIYQSNAPKPPSFSSSQQLLAKNQREDPMLQSQENFSKISSTNNLLQFSPMMSSPNQNAILMHQPQNPTMSQTYQTNTGVNGTSLKSSFKHLFLSTLSGQSIDDKNKNEVINESIDADAQAESLSIGTQRSIQSQGRNKNNMLYKTLSNYTAPQYNFTQTPELDDKYQNETIKSGEGLEKSPELFYFKKPLFSPKSTTNIQKIESIPKKGNAVGITKYMNGVSKLSSNNHQQQIQKPPSSRTSKHQTLSHNQSQKNLKAANAKTPTTNSVLHLTNKSSKQERPQQTRNESRTKSHNISQPKSKVLPKSKERENTISEVTSLDRKRSQPRLQKFSSNTQSTQNLMYATQSFHNQKTSRSNSRAGQRSSKGPGANPNIYISNSNDLGSQTSRQDNTSKTMLRINKSLDKIKQIFMVNSTKNQQDSKPPMSQQQSQNQPHLPPQSTKNQATREPSGQPSSGGNYSSFIQKQKQFQNVLKESNGSATSQNSQSNHQSGKMMDGQKTKTNSSLSKKENFIQQQDQKKQTETFKKYLSTTSSSSNLHSNITKTK